ncbi:hypothetical protein ACFVH6_21935 [Spirillospora sp. NPDC127200]
MGRHLRRWGAVYILAALWLVSSLLFGLAEAAVQTNEARQHGQGFAWSEFWPAYWSGYFENLLSEWAQLAVQAVLVVALAGRLFRRSEEQQITTVREALTADLRRIEAKLDALTEQER